MIGNSDIFDEDELMAIAEDESSEGSCQDSNDAPTNYDFGDMKEKTSNTADTNMKQQGNDDGLSSDDSSDDGGFLESWLKAEKKKKSDSNIHQDIQISQNDDEDIPNKEHKTMKNTMQLGDSVLQWIESSKRKKRSDNDCGIVGIQQNHDGEATFSQTSTLKLTKPNTKMTTKPRHRCYPIYT